MDKWLGNRNGKQRLITSIFEFVGGGFQCAVLLRVNRRTAAMKISRYFRDGLLATDRLERHRAFPGRRNAVCRDLLESHFYPIFIVSQVVGMTILSYSQKISLHRRMTV